MIEIQLPIETALDVPLSTEERSDLERAEATIQRGQQTFIEVGLALADIRDRRLYRESHTSLESYLRDKFPDLTRRHAYRLIDGATTAAVVSHRTQLPAPTSERAVRPLTQLPAEQAQAVYAQAVASNGGAAPTGPQVEAALLDRIRSAIIAGPRRWDEAEALIDQLPGLSKTLFSGDLLYARQCDAALRIRDVWKAAHIHSQIADQELCKRLAEIYSGVCRELDLAWPNEDYLIKRVSELGYSANRHSTGYRISRSGSQIPMGGVKNLAGLREWVQSVEWLQTQTQTHPQSSPLTCCHCGIAGAILISGLCESCDMLNQAKQHEGEEMRWRLHMALKSAEAMPESYRRARIAEIRDMAEAHGIDVDAPIIEVAVAAPLPPPPPPPPTMSTQARCMHIEAIFAGMIEKLDAQEQRLLEAILFDAVGDSEESEGVWNLGREWIGNADGILHWIMEGGDA